MIPLYTQRYQISRRWATFSHTHTEILPLFGRLGTATPLMDKESVRVERATTVVTRNKGSLRALPCCLIHCFNVIGALSCKYKQKHLRTQDLSGLSNLRGTMSLLITTIYISPSSSNLMGRQLLLNTCVAACMF